MIKFRSRQGGQGIKKYLFGFFPIVYFSILFLFLSTAFADVADVREEINYPGYSDNVYWFVHLSDTHIGKKGDDENKNLGKMATEVFNAVHPGFVVNTGDLVDGSNCENNADCGGSDISSCLKYCLLCYETIVAYCNYCNTCLTLQFHPYSEEWQEYNNILKDTAFRDKYYDFPGNHDRYLDFFWDQHGYKEKSILGPKIPNESPVGQFGWLENNNFFYGLNTTDESAADFAAYFFLAFVSDYPYLSKSELGALNNALYNFKQRPGSKLSFLFGHHPIDDGQRILPGLSVDKGSVFSWLTETIYQYYQRVPLFDGSLFQEKGSGEILYDPPISCPRVTPFDVWDKFTWDGKSGNSLIGIPTDTLYIPCLDTDAINWDHETKKYVAGSVDNLGASDLINMALRVIEWVKLYLLEHASKDFQPEIIFVS